MDTGPVSVANGVVYVGSMAGFPGSTLGKPTMFALDARTGKELWRFVSGGSVNAAPAIVDGRLFWGSGFANYGLGDSNHKLRTAELGQGTRQVCQAGAKTSRSARRAAADSRAS
jgi:hypothetical protein